MCVGVGGWVGRGNKRSSPHSDNWKHTGEKCTRVFVELKKARLSYELWSSDGCGGKDRRPFSEPPTWQHKPGFNLSTVTYLSSLWTCLKIRWSQTLKHRFCFKDDLFPVIFTDNLKIRGFIYLKVILDHAAWTSLALMRFQMIFYNGALPIVFLRYN